MHIEHDPFHSCGSTDHFARRTFLKSMGMLGLTWLTPLADLLAVSSRDRIDLKHRVAARQPAVTGS